MKIFKNNIEINVDNKVTKIQIDENDTININEYVRFFNPKLELGALVLEDNVNQIHIENITNVINSSNASVIFNDCTINSMDELFELIKHSLGSGFHVDLQNMMNEDDGAVELALFEVIDDSVSLEETQEDKLLINDEIFEEKQNLLIVIYSVDTQSILNFPMLYSDLSILKNSWKTVHIIFWGRSVNCIINDSTMITKVEELKVSGIQIDYYDTLNECTNESQINDIGMHHNAKGHELLTNALKSKEWTVLTV